MRSTTQFPKKAIDNFIFDVTGCPLSEEELFAQVEGVFRSAHTRVVDEIVIVKDGKLRKVFKRKNEKEPIIYPLS